MASKLMWTTAIYVFLSWNYASSVSAGRDENGCAADVLNGIQRDTNHSNGQLPVARDNHNLPSTGWGFDPADDPVSVLPPSVSPASANNPSAEYGDRILQTADVPNEPSLVDGSRGTKSECSENASDRLDGTTTVRKTIVKKRKNVRRKYQDAHPERSNDGPNANIDDGIKNIGNVQVPFGVPVDNLDASVISSLTQNDGGPSGSNFKSTKTAKCLDDKLLNALKSNRPYDSTVQRVKPTETFEKYDENIHRFLNRPLVGILPPPNMFDTIPQPVLPETSYNQQALQQALPLPFVTRHPIKPITRPNTAESPVPSQMMNPEAFFHKQSIVEDKRPLFEVDKQQGPEYVPYNVRFEPVKLPSAQYTKPACRSTSTVQQQPLSSALPETVVCDDRRTRPLKLSQWTAQNQNTGENTYQIDTNSENILRDRYKPNSVSPAAASSPGRPAYFVAPTLTEMSFNKKPLQQQQRIKYVTSPPRNVNSPVVGPLFRPTPTGTNVATYPQYVQPSRPSVAVSLSPIRAEVTEPTPQLSPVEEEISIPQLDDGQRRPIINLSSAPQLVATSVVESKLQPVPTEKDASVSLSDEEDNNNPSIDLPTYPDFVAPKPMSVEKEVSVSQPYTSTHLPVPPKLTKTKAVESTSGPVPVYYPTPQPYYGQPSKPFVDSSPPIRHITTSHVTGSIMPQQQQVPARKDVLFSTVGTAAVPHGEVRFKPQVGNRENHNDAYGNYTPIKSQPGHGTGAFRPNFGPSGTDRWQTLTFERPDDGEVPYGEKPVVVQSFARPQLGSPWTLPAVPYRSSYSGQTMAEAYRTFPKVTEHTGRWNVAGSERRVSPLRLT